MGSRTVTLMSIYDLIRQLGLSDSNAERSGAAASHRSHGRPSLVDDSYDSGVSEDEDESSETCSSVIIEGLYLERFRQKCHRFQVVFSELGIYRYWPKTYPLAKTPSKSDQN